MHEDDNLPDIDWDKDTEFDFSFDIGLAPEVDLYPQRAIIYLIII